MRNQFQAAAVYLMIVAFFLLCTMTYAYAPAPVRLVLTAPPTRTPLTLVLTSPPPVVAGVATPGANAP